ncbi:MAG: hypothetical protein AAF719_03330 [Pseudomonadota bacterium]
MSLQNVSETALEEVDARKGAKYSPIADIKPPVDLGRLDLFTQGQPYSGYAEMRENAPILWHPEDRGAGFWALTRCDDVKRVELDTDVFSSQKGGIMMNYGMPDQRHPLLHRASLDTMICLDQPLRMNLRREHMAYFTPGYVSNLRKRVEEKASSLLDDMARKGPQFGLLWSARALRITSLSASVLMSVWTKGSPTCNWRSPIRRFLDVCRTPNGRARFRLRRTISSTRFQKSAWICDPTARRPK